jgi:hypothetical protein
VAGSWEFRKEPSVSIKGNDISWPAKRLSASQGGIICIELYL